MCRTATDQSVSEACATRILYDSTPHLMMTWRSDESSAAAQVTNSVPATQVCVSLSLSLPPISSPSLLVCVCVCVCVHLCMHMYLCLGSVYLCTGLKYHLVCVCVHV